MNTILTEQELNAVSQLNEAESSAIYKELRHTVTKAGLLDRAYGFYLMLTLISFSGFFASFALVYYASNTMMVVLGSVLFAFFSVQVGGLVHDAGHRAMFKRPLNNDIFAHCCSLFFAACYNNWRINHNRHHAYPNQEQKDPDMEIPFCFTSYRFKNLSGMMSRIKKYQLLTYYPIGTLASLTMRYKRYDYFRENFGPQIYWEIALFVASFCVRYILPFALLGFQKALLFLIVSTMLEGLYMFHLFAPNHKGKLELGPDIKMSYLEQQILTSQNVKGNALTDYIYMGLNYQIEHHLFPRTPRCNFPKMRPHVKAVCEKYGLNYSETSVIQSNREILSTLNAVSKLAA
ncbi:MAG: acyl-CoA desaturase [Gammaproteobacteria bacterium]|nr:acyl-CoA desaturase [Gammaproteobacteria bacterium]